jgi:acyl-CoA thioesterase FadM
MRLLTHPVRFGDTTVGRSMHSETLFDLLAVALEELGEAVDYPFTEILSNGGTPYAPVDVRGRVSQYPVHGETVRVEGEPVEISTRSFVYQYVFRRATDGTEYCRMQATHVTIDADGDAEPLPEHVRASLSASLDAEDRELTDKSVGASGYPTLGEYASVAEITDCDDEAPPATFSRDFRIGTPHIEAADWGYFEEYFRFISLALEEQLVSRGVDPADICEKELQIQPVAWHVTFEDVVPYGSTLTVNGAIQESDEESATVNDALTVRYHLDSDRGTHIRAVFEYACIGPDKSAKPVPSDVFGVFQSK